MNKQVMKGLYSNSITILETVLNFIISSNVQIKNFMNFISKEKLIVCCAGGHVEQTVPAVCSSVREKQYFQSLDQSAVLHQPCRAARFPTKYGLNFKIGIPTVSTYKDSLVLVVGRGVRGGVGVTALFFPSVPPESLEVVISICM